MRRAPAIVVLLGGTLATCALAGAGKPRDYRAELRQAQSQQQRRRYGECIDACEKMLTYYKEAWQVQEITWLKIESLISDTQYETALKALSALAAAFPGEKNVQTAAALRTGDVQRMLKRYDDALATYRKAAEACAGEEPDRAAEALLRAGEVLCADLTRPEDGIAAYQEVETTFGGKLPQRGAEALRRIAAAHEERTKDPARAAAAYQTLTEKYDGAYDDRTLAQFYARTVDCLLRAGKPAEAVAAAGKGEARIEAPAEKASLAVRGAGILAEMAKPAEARGVCERVLSSYPLEARACRQAQGQIVEAYRAEGKWTEALGAARVLYDAADSEQDIRAAAQTVAQAFLAADGNLQRANEFLTYQRYGPDGPDGKPKTEDDVATNHLAKVKYPPFSQGANGRFRKAIAAAPDNYQGHRAKGMLYVYWGKPKEAAGEFFRAFKAADLASVQAAAQELVLIGMKAHTASFHDLGRIFEYLSYGPKGKSGKEKIPDPFAGLP